MALEGGAKLQKIEVLVQDELLIATHAAVSGPRFAQLCVRSVVLYDPEPHLIRLLEVEQARRPNVPLKVTGAPQSSLSSNPKRRPEPSLYRWHACR